MYALIYIYNIYIIIIFLFNIFYIIIIITLSSIRLKIPISGQKSMRFIRKRGLRGLERPGRRRQKFGVQEPTTL